MLKAHPQKLVEMKLPYQSRYGIGSSAASGGYFGINELLGKPFTAHGITFAMEGEALASGSAHADNVAPVLMGGITLVDLLIYRLISCKGVDCVILHPKIELKTMHAREIIKKNVMEKAIQQWANLGAFVSVVQ